VICFSPPKSTVRLDWYLTIPCTSWYLLKDGKNTLPKKHLSGAHKKYKRKGDEQFIDSHRQESVNGLAMCNIDKNFLDNIDLKTVDFALRNT
jgi:hypothetical protein